MGKIAPIIIRKMLALLPKLAAGTATLRITSGA